jgi:glycerate kinase
MNVLIAPDKFKGTLDAPAVARAMEKGARRALPDASIVVLPLADGGEGTVAACLSALGGELLSVDVSGPLGEPVRAAWARLSDGRAALEMSSASGLSLVEEGRRDALAASSRGTGEVLRVARSRGATSVVVGIGGSASTDGGTGAAGALGWRFLDGRGRELPPGGGPLRSLRRIDGEGAEGRDTGGEVVGACDVDNPLLGPRGAAHGFAPQKGAARAEVALLEEGLVVLAERIRADLGLDVAGRWGAGAGGGMGAGLIAFLGARLEPGFDLVADAAELVARVEAADIVVTGEGRLDVQSAGGKVPVGVARAARRTATACVVVAGEIALSGRQLAAAGFTRAAALVAEVGEARARSETPGSIAAVTERLLREVAGEVRLS